MIISGYSYSEIWNVQKHQKVTTLRQYDITVAYKPTYTLHCKLSKPKDKIDLLGQTNVVYQIQCSNCDKMYVGQTGRKLATRIHEHQLVSRRHDALLAIHEDREGHQLNWDSVKIIGHGKHEKTTRIRRSVAFY